MGTVHYIAKEVLAGSGASEVRNHRIRVALKIRRQDGTLANAAVRKALEDYRANGWNIIACHGDKTPIGARWNEIARTEQQLLRDLENYDAVGIGFPRRRHQP